MSKLSAASSEFISANYAVEKGVIPVESVVGSLEARHLVGNTITSCVADGLNELG